MEKIKFLKELVPDKEVKKTITVTKQDAIFGVVLEISDLENLKKDAGKYLNIESQRISGIVKSCNGKKVLVYNPKLLVTDEELKISTQEVNGELFIIFSNGE